MIRHAIARRLAAIAGVVVLPLFASAFACSNSDSEGISVGIDLDAPTRTAPQSSASTWTTDLGYQVDLQVAYLATGSVEIMPCGSQALRIWDYLLERKAYAHVGGSPTKLGTPVVESLLATGDARVHVGTLAPPPNSYCMVRYTITPADRDAVGLPSDVNMVGASFFARGRVSKSGGAWTPFEASSTKALQVDLPVGTVALSISGSRTTVFGVKKVADAWFNGIDFAQATPDQIADGAMNNIRGSLSAVQQ